MTPAGELKWTAKIEKPPAGKMPSGGANDAQWQFVANRRCKIEEITGTKVADGTYQRKVVAWYRVTLRIMPELVSNCRMTIAGRPFDGLVMYVENIRRGVTEIDLTCVVTGAAK